MKTNMASQMETQLQGVLDGVLAAPWRRGWQRSYSCFMLGSFHPIASRASTQLQLRHVREFPSHASKPSDARDAMGRLFGFR